MSRTLNNGQKSKEVKRKKMNKKKIIQGHCAISGENAYPI